MLRCCAFALLLGLLLLNVACHSSSSPKTYCFISHTYQWGAKDNNEVDHRLRAMDFEAFDQIWLGGDLCARSSERSSTLHYLDSIFFISQPSTHWSLGNHDLTRGSLSDIKSITQRPSFYTRSFDGLCLLVLNTNFNHPQLTAPDECAQQNQQFALLKSITDTISKASHLIILHHHCLLTNTLTNNQLDMDTIFHYYRPQLAFSCQPPGSFEQLVYPLLRQVQKRGVQVLLIAGDLGQRQKTFEFRTAEGIYFLGTGINNSLDPAFAPDYVTNFDPDRVLLFEHFPEERRLEWEFVLLEKLRD
ncbi:MAG: hypothetical protein AAGG75_04475 [Bacteroidota bacterium]